MKSSHLKKKNSRIQLDKLPESHRMKSLNLNSNATIGSFQSHNKPEYLDEINDFMSKKLRELNKLKRDALQDVPCQMSPIVALLQMPQIMNALKKLSRVYILRWLEYGFEGLSKYSSYCRFIEEQQKIRNKRILVLQCLYRTFLAKKRVYHLRLQRKWHNTAIMIQSRYRCHRHQVAYRYIMILQNSVKLLKLRHQCILIQKRIRGFLCRARMSNTQRIALHRELNDWANGSVLKLFDKQCLKDESSKAFVKSAIDLSLIPSKPLREASPWLRLHAIRKEVFNRRFAEECTIGELHSDYLLRLQERSEMRREEEWAQFLASHERMLRAIRKLKQDEERLKNEMISLDNNRRQRLLDAEKVLAANRFDAMRERMERELMLLEDYSQHRAQFLRRALELRSMHMEKELMRYEDHRGREIREAHLEALMTQERQDEHLQLIRLAKLEGDRIWGEGGKTYGTSILERRRRMRFRDGEVELHTGSQPITILPKNTQVGTIPILADTIAVLKEDRRALMHWWRYQDFDEEVTNLGFLNDEYLTEKCQIMRSLSWSIPTDDRTSRAEIEAENLVTTVNESMLLNVWVDLETSVTSKVALLKAMRNIERNRFICYTRLCMSLASFRNCHKELVDLRLRLLKKRYPTRSERKNALDRAVDLEHMLPMYKEIIIASMTSLKDLERAEVRKFVQLFHLQVEETVKIVEEDNSLNLEGPMDDTTKNPQSPEDDMTDICFIKQERPVVLVSWIFDTLSSKPYVMSPVTKRYLNNLLNVDKYENITSPLMPTNEEDEPWDDARKQHPSALPGLSAFDAESCYAFDFFCKGENIVSWSANLQGWLHARKMDWKQKYRQTCISYLQRMMWIMAAKGEVSSEQSVTAQIVSKAPALDLLELCLCRSQINLQVQLPESDGPVTLSIGAGQAERVLGRHPASAFGRLLSLRALFPEGSVSVTSGKGLGPKKTKSVVEQAGREKKDVHIPENKSASLDRTLSPIKKKVRLPSRRVLSTVLPKPDIVQIQTATSLSTADFASKPSNHSQRREETKPGNSTLQVPELKRRESSPLKLHLQQSGSPKAKQVMRQGKFSIGQIRKESSSLQTGVISPGSLVNGKSQRLVLWPQPDATKADALPEDELLERIIARAKTGESPEAIAARRRALLDDLCAQLDRVCSDRASRRQISDVSAIISTPALLSTAVEHECREVEEIIKQLCTRNLIGVRGGAITATGKLKNELFLQETCPAKFIGIKITSHEWEVSFPSWQHPVYHWGEQAVAEPPLSVRRQSIVKKKSGSEILKDFFAKEHVIQKFAEKLHVMLFKRVNERRELLHKQWKKAEQSHLIWEDARSQFYEEREHLKLLQAAQGVLEQSHRPNKKSRHLAHIVAEENELKKAKEKSKRRMDAALKTLNSQPLYWPDVPVKLGNDGQVKKKLVLNDTGIVRKRLCWTTGESLEASTQMLVEPKVEPKVEKVPYKPPDVYSVVIPEVWIAGGFEHVLVVTRAVTDSLICGRGRPMVDLFSVGADDCDRIISARMGFLDRPLCQNDNRAFAVSMTTKGRLLSEASIASIGVNEPKSELPTLDNMKCDVLTEFLSKRYEPSRGQCALIALQRIIRRRYGYKTKY